MNRTITLQRETYGWLDNNGTQQSIEISLERCEISIDGEYRPARRGLNIWFRSERPGMPSVVDHHPRRVDDDPHYVVMVAGHLLSAEQFAQLQTHIHKIELNPAWQRQCRLAAQFENIEFRS